MRLWPPPGLAHSLQHSNLPVSTVAQVDLGWVRPKLPPQACLLSHCARPGEDQG